MFRHDLAANCQYYCLQPSLNKKVQRLSPTVSHCFSLRLSPGLGRWDALQEARPITTDSCGLLAQTFSPFHSKHSGFRPRGSGVVRSKLVAMASKLAMAKRRVASKLLNQKPVDVRPPCSASNCADTVLHVESSARRQAVGLFGWKGEKLRSTENETCPSKGLSGLSMRQLSSESMPRPRQTLCRCGKCCTIVLYQTRGQILAVTGCPR